jgi:hypothetical protein
MQDLVYAAKEKQTDEHKVIDEAIRDQAEGYTVFSVPVGVIFRPSDAKIKNAQKKDYLGQAKLIAATDARDGFTGFTGAEIKRVMPLSWIILTQADTGTSSVSHKFSLFNKFCKTRDGEGSPVIQIQKSCTTRVLPYFPGNQTR